MSSTEREAQREDVRARIVEAARDIVSEEGLDALSMRALALRIGHSPGTIYMHFRDKDDLLQSVMAEGFRRLGEAMESELAKLDAAAGPLARYAASGRGYARFALENTGYFRAMFKVPAVAQLKGCPESGFARDELVPRSVREERGAELLRRAMEAGEADVGDPVRAATVGWGLIHGLTSLYLSGHLTHQVGSHEEFMELIESAIEALGRGWLPRRGSVED
ncbi:MAG: TetR/AcrR family transcriptional regulator [Gemmatimonadota bacterium]